MNNQAPINPTEPKKTKGAVKKRSPVTGKNPVSGLVIRYSKTHFTVRTDLEEIECRIKGKFLKSAGSYYNPIAPGDVVETENALILAVKKRRNLFARFNQKGQSPQILAANVDLVFCVTSLSSPPFRPRFLDRVLLQADAAGIPAAVICNKYDLSSDIDIEERLTDYERIGYPVFRISVLSGAGLAELKEFLSGKFSVLVGQSGVGKSSLVNALIPGLKAKTGTVNEKFNRGNHTTTQSVLLDVPNTGLAKTQIIDTPGIRRFFPAGISGEDTIFFMREFASLAGKCSYGLSCSHEMEIGCKVLEAVSAGVIHEDRYESFLRIRDDLNGKREYPDLD